MQNEKQLDLNLPLILPNAKEARQLYQKHIKLLADELWSDIITSIQEQAKNGHIATIISIDPKLLCKPENEPLSPYTEEFENIIAKLKKNGYLIHIEKNENDMFQGSCKIAIAWCGDDYFKTMLNRWRRCF